MEQPSFFYIIGRLAICIKSEQKSDNLRVGDTFKKSIDIYVNIQMRYLDLCEDYSKKEVIGIKKNIV